MSELELVLPAARRRVRDLLARWSEAVAPDDAPTLTERAARESVRGVESVIGDCGLYEDGRRVPGRLPLPACAGGGREHARVRLDRAAATRRQQELDHRGARVRAAALAVEDAIKAHQRPKLEVLRRRRVRRCSSRCATSTTTRSWTSARSRSSSARTSSITVRHGESDVLRRVRAELDGDAPELLQHGPSAVLYRAADLVVDGYEEAIACITVDIDEIESQVFGGRGRGPRRAHLQAQAGGR